MSSSDPGAPPAELSLEYALAFPTQTPGGSFRRTVRLPAQKALTSIRNHLEVADAGKRPKTAPKPVPSGHGLSGLSAGSPGVCAALSPRTTITGGTVKTLPTPRRLVKLTAAYHESYAGAAADSKDDGGDSRVTLQRLAR